MSSSMNGRHGIDKVFAYTGVVLAIVITAILSWLVLRGAGALRRLLGVNDAVAKKPVDVPPQIAKRAYELCEQRGR